MPSLTQMDILKTIFTKHKTDFEDKYIVPTQDYHILICVAIISCILGGGVRIYYNGFIPALTLLFELSWFGFGWGKTPWLVALLANISGAFIGAFIGLYVINVKRRYMKLKAFSAPQFMLLVRNDFNQWRIKASSGYPSRDKPTGVDCYIGAHKED